MAVALVNSSSSGVSDSQATSRTVNVPAGAASGHVALFIMEMWQSTATNPTVTWPSGFVEIVNYVSTTDGFEKLKVARKVLTGADSGTYNATWSGTHWIQAQCILVSGVDNTTPLDVAVNLAQNSTGTALPSNALTTANAGCFLVHVVANENSSSGTPPTGYTETQDANYLRTNYKVAGAAGSESISGGSLSASTLKLAALIALRAASGGGTTPVTGTRATTWRVRAAVASTRATTWRVRSSVTATRATMWDALARVSSTRSTTWAVDARVTASRSTTWDTAGRVTSTRSTTWDARTLVTASRSSTWNVSSTLTSVTANRSTTWAVIGRVTSSRTSTWDVLLRATSTRSTAWVVRARVSSPRATLWDVLVNPTGTRATMWRVLSGASADRVTSWRTLASATDSRSTTWDVEVIVGEYEAPQEGMATVRPFFTLAITRPATATAVVRSPAATATVRSTDEAG